MSLLESAPKRFGAFDRAGEREMRAHRTYDKLAFLVALTALSAAITAPFVSKSASLQALLVPTMVICMGCALAGSFRPQWAKKVAPVYAILEGVVLGAISKAYTNVAGSSIVPTAIIITSAVFVGCLLLFRSGVVKVTPKFVSMIGIAGMALFAVYVAALFGLKVPGVDELGPRGLIFGVIGFAIAVGYLFIDFDRVEKFEKSGTFPETAEWFLAFQLLLSLVMVYVNVLRILASTQRRN